MWKCTNCAHLELGPIKPERCPVCGAAAEKMVPHEVPGIRGEKTIQNLKMGFIAESQASVRNRAFAMKADQEDYTQMASLFRAIAESEAISASAGEGSAGVGRGERQQGRCGAGAGVFRYLRTGSVADTVRRFVVE